MLINFVDATNDANHYTSRHPLANTSPANCYLRSEWILMKLGINVHRISGHCWKGFQGQRSKVKVIPRPSTRVQRMHIFQRTLENVNKKTMHFLFYFSLSPPLKNPSWRQLYFLVCRVAVSVVRPAVFWCCPSVRPLTRISRDAVSL